MKKSTATPDPGTGPTRNDFGPREVIEILALLQRRQWARKARTSTTLRMRGGCA